MTTASKPDRIETTTARGLSRRHLGRIAVGAAAVAALAPGTAGAEATPSASPLGPRGGTLTYARSGDADTLDPQHTNAGISWEVLNNISGYGVEEPDMLRQMTHTNWGIGRYHDEQYQTLVSNALETSDPAKRTEFYFEAAKKMLADAAMVPMYSSLAVAALRSRVKNYRMGHTHSWGIYEDVSIEGD